MDFKFKPQGKSLDEIEKEIDRLKAVNVPEIPFMYVKNILEALGAEWIQPRPRGSQERFYHPLLLGTKCNGYMSIHLLHSKEPKIRRNDYRAYLYKDLKLLITLLRK